MSLTVVLGGARSGKSSLALRLAADAGRPVTFVATGEARDEEMAARIDAHRRERPRAWATVEEPVELRRVLDDVSADETVVVDCLTLWVANVLERGLEPDDVAPAAASRPGLTIAVSNEVGLGIVPENALARAFRDVLGRVNMEWVAASERALFCVAGRAVEL
ncbi:MAG TPA: bifunctional adenosylcobinamide kinase/adenosylcobinamide-phosphate guanylyltransferase [Gaiellaceae bacterium]